MAGSRKKSNLKDIPGAEELLLEATWCKALNRITDEFLHDIRSKLTGLYTGLQLCPTKFDGSCAEMFGLMKESAREVTEFLRMIMQLRNPKREFGLHDLSTLTNETVAILKAVLGCERVQFDLKNEPLPIKADPDQIQRALLLLALRVADGVPKKAKITLRASEINELPPVKNPHPKLLKPPCVCVSISSEAAAPIGQAGDNKTPPEVLLARHLIDQAHGLVLIDASPMMILPGQKL